MASSLHNRLKLVCRFEHPSENYDSLFQTLAFFYLFFVLVPVLFCSSILFPNATTRQRNEVAKLSKLLHKIDSCAIMKPQRVQRMGCQVIKRTRYKMRVPSNFTKRQKLCAMF